MTRFSIPICLSLLLACASSRSAERPQATESTATSGQPGAAAAPRAQPGGMAAMCPMAVPGTSVSAEDTPTGEAMTFKTKGDVAELRRRVRAMAAMHQAHQPGQAGSQPGQGAPAQGMSAPCGQGGGCGDVQPGMGCCGEGMAHGGMGPGMMPPPARVTVTDVEGGARLELTPEDPATLDQLRSTVRMHAQQMQRTGGCGMRAHRRFGGVG